MKRGLKITVFISIVACGLALAIGWVARVERPATPIAPAVVLGPLLEASPAAVLEPPESPAPSIAPPSSGTPAVDRAGDSKKRKGMIGRGTSAPFGVETTTPFSMIVVGRSNKPDGPGNLDGMRTSAPVDRVYSMVVITPSLEFTAR